MTGTNLADSENVINIEALEQRPHRKLVWEGRWSEDQTTEGKEIYGWRGCTHIDIYEASAKVKSTREAAYYLHALVSNTRVKTDHLACSRRRIFENLRYLAGEDQS